jgi:hypothetical protein
VSAEPVEGGPYARGAASVQRSKLGCPIPIPFGQKGPPPPGLTGYQGRYLSEGEVVAYARTHAGHNLAVRLAPDIVGIDLDRYHGGDEGMADLVARWGPLPPTYASTSRVDGSAIALYRVPPGRFYRTNPAKGVDVIQPAHRYVLAAPSLHPEGGIYRWFHQAEPDVVLDGPPDAADAADLPWRWQAGLEADPKVGVDAPATAEEIVAFARAHAQATRPEKLKGIETALDRTTGQGRHDTLVKVACWAAREAMAKRYPWAEAEALLAGWWARVMDDPQRRDGIEYASAIAWAVAAAKSDPDRIETMVAEDLGSAEVAQGSALTLWMPSGGPTGPFVPLAPSSAEMDGPPGPPTVPPNLPDEFWNERPELAHIRQAAHARGASADAVLVCVLARVAVTIAPGRTLPDIVGSRGSLNFCTGIIGKSGKGKSIAMTVADELFPIDHPTLVPSTGEGIVMSYLTPAKDADGKVDRSLGLVLIERPHVLFHVDEGQGMLAQGSRQGATLLPILRSAWSGVNLGQANANLDARRYVPAGSYRFAIVVGFQLGVGSTLVADADGGTPQRFVFASAVDPLIPLVKAPWPGPLDVPLGAWHAGPMACAQEIADEVWTAHVRSSRGEVDVDDLDSHRNQTRLKVACLLAVMAGRLDVGVDVDDWRLAGMILDTSDAVRASVVDHARAKAAEVEGGGTRKMVARAGAIADNAVQRTADGFTRCVEAVGRKVWRDATETVGIARKEAGKIPPKARAAARDYPLDEGVSFTTAVIEAAVDAGFVVEVEGLYRRGPVEPPEAGAGVS